jgi:hypothetical protein
MMTTPINYTPVHPTTRPRPARQARAALRIAALAFILGCSGVDTVAPYQPITDGERLYARLALEHRAINLALAAPYDTLQLRAAPLNAYGQPIAGFSAATFRSLDTALVTVSADGLLQAVRVGGLARIVAELAIPGNARHVDTAVVNVTSGPAPQALASLDVAPVPPATTRWRMLGANPDGALILYHFGGVDIGLSPAIAARALDQSGAPIAGLAIDYREQTPGGLTLDRYTGMVLNFLRMGEQKLIASTVAYGVARADTITVTVESPLAHGILIEAIPGHGVVATPSEVEIPLNGYVFWENDSGAPVSVEFNNPAPLAEPPMVCAVLQVMCGTGDIAPFSGSIGGFQNINGRQFTATGVYTWRIPTLGITGTVTVVDDVAP